ncbi:hypothetical protein BALOs_0737 [Halobacteriovorax sp. BALOs_7]|uniref:nucleotidyltransferase domain-containing protein n=1 Tax=Halobacteriovorax sp. BALOs_7 TaxID=2109558 RepID=UPI000EB70CCF|nr:nucleotidyltransferase [Halobacteriovorax sp. BALOs_7]AYF43747.1 hypothetical protein BALOs_0737 [Halobacteriovorax sp. BALOs_7]
MENDKRLSLLGDLLLKSSTPRSRWSSRFETWAKPLSTTEDQKCQNAKKVISDALDGHKEMAGLNYEICPQGSYIANTNVRQNSDVDIRVHCSDTFHYKLPLGLSASDVEIYPATLSFNTYREKVLQVLNDRFGSSNVKNGDKAFHISENTYRINADVVPAFDYREYYWVGSSLYFRTGSCFFSKSDEFIVNWPEQTLANGKAKNTRTGYRYKKVVRVLKGLRNEMEEKGYSSAKLISSHLIACLAYNISDRFYGKSELYDDVKSVVGQIWYHTYQSNLSSKWTEIDEIKLLFTSSRLSKVNEVKDFFWDLMEYAELRDEK